MRKIFLISLIAICSFSLTACGSNESEKSKNESEKIIDKESDDDSKNDDSENSDDKNDSEKADPLKDAAGYYYMEYDDFQEWLVLESDGTGMIYGYGQEMMAWNENQIAYVSEPDNSVEYAYDDKSFVIGPDKYDITYTKGSKEEFEAWYESDYKEMNNIYDYSEVYNQIIGTWSLLYGEIEGDVWYADEEEVYADLDIYVDENDFYVATYRYDYSYGMYFVGPSYVSIYSDDFNNTHEWMALLNDYGTETFDGQESEVRIGLEFNIDSETGYLACTPYYSYDDGDNYESGAILFFQPSEGVG